MKVYEGEPGDLIPAFTNGTSDLSRHEREMIKAYQTFLAAKGDPEFIEKIEHYSDFHPASSFKLQYTEDQMLFFCYDAFGILLSMIARTRRTPKSFKEHMESHFTNKMTKQLIERIRRG